jgi:hypothetical protein
MLAEFQQRARRNLNLADFASGSHPIHMIDSVAVPPVDRQYILRMMVRSPGSCCLYIPNELDWLRSEIELLCDLQDDLGFNNQYVYVTVRHGIVTSSRDAEWHVDGFSMRCPHLPEQDYVCSHSAPTEFLLNNWEIPADFDPFKHNIHRYFQDREDQGERFVGAPHRVYLMDPYCVHHRPLVAAGTMRTFWRVSFVPIEIEDDTCTQNPLLPRKVHGRSDIRNVLVRY